jgi:hypothetical protein
MSKPKRKAPKRKLDSTAPATSKRATKKQAKGATAAPRKVKAARNVATTASYPTVTYGELCDLCNDDWDDGSSYVPVNGRQFRQLLEIVAPGIAVTGKQFKYPALTHQQIVTAEHATTVRREHTYTDYSTMPEIQYLRWVSTMAYGYLIGTAKTKSRPTEIQALWDGQTLYIAENKRSWTDKLAEADDWHEYDSAFLAQLSSANARFAERYKRHANNLAALPRSKPSAVPPVLRKPIAQHTIEYPDDGVSGEKHAEIRLVEYWEQQFCPDNAKLPTRMELYVAGIKRPCLACFSRLRVLQKRLREKNVILHHKPRPGMFWPSASALRDTKEEERQEIAEHLIELWELYLTHNDTYLDSESEPESDEDDADAGEDDDEDEDEPD